MAKTTTKQAPVKTAKPAARKAAPKSAFAQLTARLEAAQDTLSDRRAGIVKFSNDNLEAFKASGQIVVKGARPLATEAVATTRRQLEAVVDSVKSLKGVKSPVEAVKLQREAAKVALAAVRADTQAFGKSLTKLVGDAAAPLKDRVAAVRKLAA